jgi:hypothetical protein
MAFRFTRCILPAGAFGLALMASACLQGLAADPSSGGERIQESAAGRPADAPPSASSQRLEDISFRFVERDSSVSGVVELIQPVQGAAGQSPLSPKTRSLLQQKADEQRNWIFLTPESADRTQTAEEAFGVNNPERKKQPQGAAENLFSSGPRPEGGLTTLQLWEAGPVDKPRPVDNNVRQSLAKGPGFDLRRSKPTPQTPSASQPGFLSAASTAPATGTEPILGGIAGASLSTLAGADPTRSGTFNVRFLLNGGGINPLAPGFDPVSLAPDATRRELNPVMPQKPREDLLTDPSQQVRNPMVLRQGLLDEMNARIQGPSSLGVAGNAEPTKVRGAAPIWLPGSSR